MFSAIVDKRIKLLRKLPSGQTASGLVQLAVPNAPIRGIQRELLIE